MFKADYEAVSIKNRGAARQNQKYSRRYFWPNRLIHQIRADFSAKVRPTVVLFRIEEAIHPGRGLF